MPKISPLYTMKLINQINSVIWDKFTEQKYRNVRLYLERWREPIGLDINGNPYEYNFYIQTKLNSEDIDLLATLGSIDEETLLKIAIDLEISTPDMIPAVVEIKEILANDHKDVSRTFEKAFKKVVEEPSISIIMANSALEAIIKKICQDETISNCNNKDTLYALISHLLKEFEYFPSKQLDNNIRNIGSSLLTMCQAIESIRSNNTEGHGKIKKDYIVDNELYSKFIINAMSTIGLFLLNYYEKQYKPKYKEIDPRLQEGYRPA